jgi:putative ABC transport system permease protein
VIGRTVREQLFGADNPIGQVARVKGLPCRVIGVLHPKGLSVSGQDQDDTILMPYTTVMKKIKGAPWLDDILCSAVSPDAVKLAGKQAGALLRDRHHLRPDAPDDFNIRNPEDIIQAQLEASRTMTILLVAIASISLVVGGIGIMNVMLVSVSERTREIGLRRAVGAKRRDVLLQFLVEAVALSCCGGLVGIVCGFAAAAVVTRVLEWPASVSPASVALAFGIAAAVGVFFGFYPARRASRLDPIDALRYE